MGHSIIAYDGEKGAPFFKKHIASCITSYTAITDQISHHIRVFIRSKIGEMESPKASRNVSSLFVITRSGCDAWGPEKR